MKYRNIIFVISIFVMSIFAQETKNVYSTESYRRGDTDPKFKYDQQIRKDYNEAMAKGNIEEAKRKLQEYFKDKYFLPNYEDMATSPNGVTEEDWGFHLLPLSEFYSLDKDDNKFVSKEELDEHPLMGSAKKHTQSRFAMIDFLKENNIENHEERIKHLQNLQYDLDKEEYYVDPNNKNPDSVGTKTYVRFENGQLVVKQLPLPQYAYALIQDQDEDDPMTMYIMGLVLVCLTAAGTIIISKFS